MLCFLGIPKRLLHPVFPTSTKLSGVGNGTPKRNPETLPPRVQFDPLSPFWAVLNRAPQRHPATLHMSRCHLAAFLPPSSLAAYGTSFPSRRLRPAASAALRPLASAFSWRHGPSSTPLARRRAEGHRRRHPLGSCWAEIFVVPWGRQLIEWHRLRSVGWPGWPTCCLNADHVVSSTAGAALSMRSMAQMCRSKEQGEVGQSC